jgi:hypothetical protein
MRIHHQNDLSGPTAGREDHTTDAPARRRWRRRRRDRENAEPAPGPANGVDHTERMPAVPSEPLAAMQLAIAMLTASLDSPELEAWAADTLIPVDTDGLGDFIAGVHVISVLLLNELHEATGEPPAAVLQRLAIMVALRRVTPSAD